MNELVQRTLHGPVETKLNLFGNILYEECSGRYGEVTIKKTVVGGKRTREKEIKEVVASRWQLHKR